VKVKWNVNPSNPTTIARLIGELEGVTYILDCLENTEEELLFLENMKKKYYKMYFALKKK
jgi:hypothetical protein